MKRDRSPAWRHGPDKRVPPKGDSGGHVYHALSEGHACHARRGMMDCQTLFGGVDKQVPPSAGPDGRVSAKGPPEGHVVFPVGFRSVLDKIEGFKLGTKGPVF
jgi:hypothetical protein